MGILMGKWDCEYCSRKGIPANIRHCPACGNPVGNDVKYYLPEGSADYVEPHSVPNGADWQCAYCGSYNRCTADLCKNCGASKLNGKDYFQVHSEDTEETVTTDLLYANNIVYHNTKQHSSDNSKAPPIEYIPLARPQPEPPQMRSNDEAAEKEVPAVRRIPSIIKALKPFKKYIFAGIAIITVIIGIVLLVTPKERILTVESFSWKRIMYIDEYKTVSESDWQMPSEGRLRYTRSEIRYYEHRLTGYKTETYTEQEIDHYEQYVSGYRDLGNGYFQEIMSSRPVYKSVTKTREVPQYTDVPIYNTKYYYYIDKWVSDHTVTTSEADKNPYWGQEPPPISTPPAIGDERVSSRTEHYYFVGVMVDSDKSQNYAISYADWIRLQDGDTIRCNVYITGNVELLDIITEE